MHWAGFSSEVTPKFDLARQRQHVYAYMASSPEVRHAQHRILHIVMSVLGRSLGHLPWQL
jgi:hypothetical protein